MHEQTLSLVPPTCPGATNAEPVYAPVDVRATLARVIQRARASAAAKGIGLWLRVHDEVPAIVYGDDRQLEWLFAQLIGDAVDATDVGAVDVEVYPTVSAGSARAGEVVLQTVIVDSRRGPWAPSLREPSPCPGALGEPYSLARAIEALGGSLLVHLTPGEGAITHLDISVEAAAIARHAA